MEKKKFCGAGKEWAFLVLFLMHYRLEKKLIILEGTW
jgi:hypothetical protein